MELRGARAGRGKLGDDTGLGEVAGRVVSNVAMRKGALFEWRL